MKAMIVVSSSDVEGDIDSASGNEISNSGAENEEIVMDLEPISLSVVQPSQLWVQEQEQSKDIAKLPN